MTDRYVRIAEALTKAREAGIPCAPVRSQFPTVDIAEAYKVQKVLHTARIAKAGCCLVGHKIGFSSKMAMEKFKVSEPAYGRLYNDMEVLSGSTLEIGRTIQPLLEGEVAFVLGADLEGAQTVADVISAVAYALPAIEIVGPAVQLEHISAQDMIADNAGGSFFVLGHTPKRLCNFDPVNCEMVMTVNGAEQTRGFGRSNYGSPINTLTWLARQTTDLRDDLKAGDVILSGSLGAMIPAKAGDQVLVSMGGLGDVCVNFSK